MYGWTLGLSLPWDRGSFATARLPGETSQYAKVTNDWNTGNAQPWTYIDDMSASHVSLVMEGSSLRRRNQASFGLHGDSAWLDSLAFRTELSLDSGKVGSIYFNAADWFGDPHRTTASPKGASC